MAPEAVNLNQIITGMGELLRTAVGATNRIETVLADLLSSALVDPSQIETCHFKLGDQRPGRDVRRGDDHDRNLERQARRS